MRRVAFLIAVSVLLGGFSVLAGGRARFVDVIVVLDAQYAPGGHANNRAAAAETAKSLGLQPRFAYGTALFGFAASVPEGRLNALRFDRRVAYIEVDRAVSLPRPVVAAPKFCKDNPDHPACADSSEDPPPSGQVVPWGVSRIGADTNASEGTGVHVYVIDTGIDSDHPDLAVGNGAAFTTCKGRCAQPWDDDNGHGTHVAGTIGALDNSIGVLGVASEVTLHAVKVLSKSGSGSLSGVIAGVDWAAAETAARGVPSVANMSLGGSGSKTGSCTGSGFIGSDSFHAAVCNAARAGVVFAVASGNAGADAQNSVPAAYDDAVITVSATNDADNWPSWSNYGDNTAGWTANVSAPVAIAAPGVNILSTWKVGDPTTISGTSMATPHVAGACALFLVSSPQQADFSAFTNTRAALLSSSESTTGFSNTSGRPHAEDFLRAGRL